MCDFRIDFERKKMPLRQRVTIAFWISVACAIGFGLIFIIDFIIHLIAFFVFYVGDSVLPVALRDSLLWFVDEVLPQLAPVVDWINSFGAVWNGLLTLISFVLAVLSIVLAFALRSRPRGTKELK